MMVTPHVAQNTKNRRSAIDARTTGILAMASVSRSGSAWRKSSLDENDWLCASCDTARRPVTWIFRFTPPRSIWSAFATWSMLELTQDRPAHAHRCGALGDRTAPIPEVGSVTQVTFSTSC